MSIANCIFPWPWKIEETGAPPSYRYLITDAQGKEICKFSGVDAKCKAEVIMELAAEKQVREQTK